MQHSLPHKVPQGGGSPEGMQHPLPEAAAAAHPKGCDAPWRGLGVMTTKPDRRVRHPKVCYTRRGFAERRCLDRLGNAPTPWPGSWTLGASASRPRCCAITRRWGLRARHAPTPTPLRATSTRSGAPALRDGSSGRGGERARARRRRAPAGVSGEGPVTGRPGVPADSRRLDPQGGSRRRNQPNDGWLAHIAAAGRRVKLRLNGV